MSPSKILAKIERRNAERRRLWATGGDPMRSAEIAKELESLYAELRRSRARQVNGDPTIIAQRARIERELEKLGS